MRFDSRVRSLSSFWVRAARLGLAGVVTSELLSDDTTRFVDGSLDAHLVELSILLAAGVRFGSWWL